MLMWMGRRRPTRHPVWYLRSRGYQEGLREGRLLWKVVGAVVWSGYVYKKVMHPPAEVVFRTNLEPGESLTIASHQPRRSRRKDRRARAA
jgi:hypothetical protein